MSDDGKASKLSNKPKYIDLTAPTVGYKKPPKHSQYQKGHSGNPSGKSRMPSQSLEAIFWRVSRKKVVLRTTSKSTKKVSFMEALAIALHRHALKTTAHAKLLTEIDLAFPQTDTPYEDGRIVKTEEGAYQIFAITEEELQQIEVFRNELPLYFVPAASDASED